jgi:hypothetical protein
MTQMPGGRPVNLRKRMAERDGKARVLNDQPGAGRGCQAEMNRPAAGSFHQVESAERPVEGCAA